MKTAVFAFGRMNPPTIGHGKLVDKVKAVARSNRGDALIYLSHTHNDDKDPLPYDKKIKHAQSAFGRKIVKKSNSTTVIKVVKEIEKMGYDQVIMVAGSDRVDEFKKLLTKYNGPGKDWNFKKVSVVSAGQRDPDAEGAAGMSATKVRAAAKAKDFNTFKQGVAKGVNVTSLYKDLSEETVMHDIIDDWEPTEEDIDNYIQFEESDVDDDEWMEIDELLTMRTGYKGMRAGLSKIRPRPADMKEPDQTHRYRPSAVKSAPTAKDMDAAAKRHKARIAPVPKSKSKEVKVASLTPSSKGDGGALGSREARQKFYNDRRKVAKAAGHPNPSLYAAQSAGETGWGKKPSARGNLVGMKARKGQDSETKTTHEYRNGKKVKEKAKFAAFSNEVDAAKQHGIEWGGTFKKDIGGKTYDYATDPKYEKMIKKIEKSYGPKKEDLDPFSEFLDERVLTIMQRLHRGRLMRRKAPRMKRMRKIKARRMAPRSRLAYRARKAAIGMLRKRYGGHKGANYANLSLSQKIQIDRAIERRKGLVDKISKRMLPKVRKKEVMRLRSARSGGVKKEAVQMDINKEIGQLFEVNYRVEVPGLPTMYVHGKSPAEVRRKLRDTVKPGMIKDIQISRVVDADVKKAFRLKAQGKDSVDDKDSRGAVDEELESFLESVSDNPKYQMKPRGPNAPSWVTGVKPKLVKPKEESAYSDQMDDAHANIYPKRQAMKWRVKPPEGTKHIHPKSKWDGMKKGDIKKSWKDGKIGSFHDNFRPGAELSLEARRGRPPKNPTGDEDQGGEHIIIQLRKSVSLRGQKHVEFGDGKKHQVPERHAQKALAMHARMKPAQKAHFEKHMSMSHSHYKDAVAGKPLPTKRNPMTNKSDHSWVDHPLGHKWKFDEETKPRIKSFNDVFEAGAIARGKSAIDRMKIPGMFGDQIGGAPPEPAKPKKKPRKKVDRTKEFQDDNISEVNEADEAPVGDHSGDFKRYKWRNPSTGKREDKKVKRKLEVWKEDTQLDEILPALGIAARGISTAAGRTIMANPVKSAVGARIGVGLTGEDDGETPEEKKARKNKEVAAALQLQGGKQMPSPHSLQSARMEGRVAVSLIRKAAESGFSKDVIYEVYYRGMAAHHDNKKAFDRVNSFINKGKARELDADLLGEE